MDLERVVGLVFILYCATAGVVLLLVPWSPGWDRMLSHLPTGFELLRLPLLRGALSGFGLVHLVWCAHDLLQMSRADAPRHGA